MNKKIGLYGMSIILFLSACTTTPITGRKQLTLIPESTMNEMAVSEYRSFLTQNKVVTSAQSKDADMVQRVGQRIATAVTTYMDANGMGDRVDNYDWQFNLVSSDEVNAWCMPGGKVVVYTGLLPITQNENALAVVLGHEISHAIAEHGNARMSKALVLQGIQVAGATGLSQNPVAQNVFLQAFGVGGQLGMQAYSRKDEYEADHLGLIFMAMAGYDPREAIPFWKRMASLSAGGAQNEILSDHPSDANRIAQIEKLMPEAMSYYKPHQ